MDQITETNSVRPNRKRKSRSTSSEGHQKDRQPKQFRSNMLATFRLLNELKPLIREEHRNCMLMTPFAHFWGAFLDGSVVHARIAKSDKLLCSIISTYSTQDSGFKLGGEVLKITVRDLELIFGVTSGQVVVCDKGVKKRETDFLIRRKVYSKAHSLTVTDINEELPILALGKTENEVKDFIKLLCLHTICTLFDATSGITIPFWLIEKVDDLDNLNTFAWNVYFTTKLQKSLSQSYTKPDLVIGCVPLISYLICEHSNLVQPYAASAIPRFLKWDLKKLRDALLRKLDTVSSERLFLGKLDVSFAESELYKISNEQRDDDILYLSSEEAVERVYEAAQEMAVASLTNVENMDNTYIDGGNTNICTDLVPLREEINEVQIDVDNEKNLAYEMIQADYEAERQKTIELERLLDQERRQTIDKENELNLAFERLKAELAAEKEKTVELDCLLAHERQQTLDNENALKANLEQSIKDYNEEVQRRSKAETELDILNESLSYESDAAVHMITQEITLGETITTLKNDMAEMDDRIKNLETELKVKEGVIFGLKDEIAGLRLINNELKVNVQVGGSNSSGATTNVQPVPKVASLDTGKHGSIEYKVKTRPRPRTFNQKYERKVVAAGVKRTITKVLTEDKSQHQVGCLLSSSVYNDIWLLYNWDPVSLSKQIWVSKCAHRYITIEDIYDILTKDEISSTYMDCYIEMLIAYMNDIRFNDVDIQYNRLKQKPFRIGRRSLFLPSLTYLYIKNEMAGFLEEVTDKLDELLENPMDYIIVPLTSDGGGHYDTRHWSLLVYEFRTKTWLFYNSFILGKEMQDLHKDDALFVALYIERYMSEKISGKPYTQLQRVNIISQPTPIQMINTKDCGVIVCYVLKQIIDGSKILLRLTANQILEARAKLIRVANNGGDLYEVY